MDNFYEIVKDGLHFNKFEADDLICVEYICPLENERSGLISQADYIVHILSGKKTWETIHGKWEMEAGDTLYVKKGAAMVRQYFEDEFCILGFFITDDLIRESVSDVKGKTTLQNNNNAHQFTVTGIQHNPVIDGFFQSMLTYFRGQKPPLDYIIKLKLKELLINLICSHDNDLLASYFRSVSENSRPSLPHIMESNFCYNLSLEEFARLTHRSLSTFKRDFFSHYNTTPGKWLLAKRLDYSAKLIRNSDDNITNIAFDSGFEDVSHFSRVFKGKFGLSPSEFRNVTI